MPDFLRVADGIVAKDRIGEAEAAQYERLKRTVLAAEARKEQDERERRVSQGLPAELSPEEKKELKRQERERREEAKQSRREAMSKSRKSSEQGAESKGRMLGMMCFGTR